MWILMAAIVVLGVGGVAAGVHPRAMAAPQEQASPTVTMCALKVSGMHCGACASTVAKAARRIEGVEKAVVSHERGRAEVTYDSTKTTPEKIAAAITKATAFKAEPEKR